MLSSPATARGFHETVAQSLTALTLGLRALSEQVDGQPEPGRTVSLLEQIAERMRDELYQLLSGARPGAGGGSPDGEGGSTSDASEGAGELAGELMRVASEWSGAGGFGVEVRVGDIGRASLKPEVRRAMVAVVREALTNAARYADSRLAVVTMAARRGRLRVSVTDRKASRPPAAGLGTDSARTADAGPGATGRDGTPAAESGETPGGSGAVGPLAGGAGGHGIRGMYEHAESVGARLTLSSSPGGGTVVAISVRLDASGERPGRATEPGVGR